MTRSAVPVRGVLHDGSSSGAASADDALQAVFEMNKMIFVKGAITKVEWIKPYDIYQRWMGKSSTGRLAAGPRSSAGTVSCISPA